MVAAYSYMALVPIIQPVAIKAVTTKAERRIRMTYRAGEVSQTAKIFPGCYYDCRRVNCAGVITISWFLNVWELIKRMWRFGSFIHYSSK